MTHPGNKKKSAPPTHQTELPQYGVGQRHPAVAARGLAAPGTPRRRVQEEPQGGMAPTRLQMGPPAPSYQVQSLGDAHNANEALYAQTPVYMNQPEQVVFQGEYMHVIAPAPAYMDDNPEGTRGPSHQVAAMSTQTTEAPAQKRARMVRGNGEHDESEDDPSYSDAESVEEPVKKKHKGKGKGKATAATRGFVEEPVTKKGKGKGKATTATRDPSPGSSGQSSTMVDVGEDDLGPAAASSSPAPPLRTAVSSLPAPTYAILNVPHAVDKLTMLMGTAHSVPTAFNTPASREVLFRGLETGARLKEVGLQEAQAGIALLKLHRETSGLGGMKPLLTEEEAAGVTRNVLRILGGGLKLMGGAFQGELQDDDVATCVAEAQKGIPKKKGKAKGKE